MSTDAFQPTRQRRTRTVRHFLVLDRLDPKHHATLRELVTARGVRVATVRRWLASMGCDVSYWAVYGYRDHLRREKKRAEHDAARADAEANRLLGYAWVAAGRRPPDFVPASVFLVEYLLFRAVMDVRHDTSRPDGRPDPRRITRHVAALSDAFGVVNALRADFRRHPWQNRTRERAQTGRLTPPAAGA
jgi:hypothetical protein